MRREPIARNLLHAIAVNVGDFQYDSAFSVRRIAVMHSDKLIRLVIADAQIVNGTVQMEEAQRTARRQ